MIDRKAETPLQTVRRHLRNGHIILTERGIVALYGAAMREVAKLVDSPIGSFLAPRDIMAEGPGVVRREGLRGAIGAVFRQVAATYDPPSGPGRNPVNDATRANAVWYYQTDELTKPDGVVPSRRPINDHDFALEVPFAFAPTLGPPAEPIAAVIHVFYPEALGDVLIRLKNIPVAVDLYLSTDTEEKRRDIAGQVASWTKGKTTIRILPNRGRDIAAKFVGFRDIYDRHPFFIHLHTKKSPHGGAPLARWRDYLLDSLLGSPDIVASILQLLDDPKIGIVFPQHLFEIRGILNWGYNYDMARRLMHGMGVSIDKNLVLEFPSGSMFWGRSAAIRPLLDAGLTYDDFPDEAGQVDGTLAHAIERVVLMAAESSGHEWCKIVKRDLYPIPKTILTVQAPGDVAIHRLKVFQPCLTSVDTRVPPYGELVRETRPISSYPSRNPRPRLNLLVPSVNPRHIFGGVATALKLFDEWGSQLGDTVDRRIITLDADVEAGSYATLPDYVAEPFGPGLDDKPRIIVDAYERDGGRLNLRERDLFVATAWWSAEIARTLESDRARSFGGTRPFVYLIQDDEPHFYGWSTKYAAAEATYRHGSETIAVINSEELFSVMTEKYKFRDAFCLPYQLNARISERLAPQPRERTILVYGRPSVWRNAFELICEGLRRWQQRDPIRASRWRIIYLGEQFDTAVVAPVQNVEVQAKVSLDDYAEHLSRAAIGISLMISPHPSYPPLEMAEAGLITITNTYAGKDLRNRFADIVSIDNLQPERLAHEIEQAAIRAEPTIGKTTPRRTRLFPPSPGPLADPSVIAALLRKALFA